MNKKNNKGFTLIELLAVTIILIIILLIALNAIDEQSKKAKRKSVEANALSYFKTVQSALDINKTEGGSLKTGIFSISELSENGVKVDGTKPDDGFIVSDNFNMVCACLSYGKYKVEKIEDEISEALKGSCDISSTDCDSYLSIRTFKYTGSEVTYKVPKSGLYKLEVWGAQGGNVSQNGFIGGYGGYSVGNIILNKDDVLSVVIGGKGENNCNTKSCAGGFNGGGSSGWYTGNSVYSSGGGGATHIAVKNSSYNTLASYENSSTASNYVLIVAGGGGGATYHNNHSTFGFSHSGGSGGGIVGYGLCSASDMADSGSSSGCGGNQTSTGNVSNLTYGTYGGFGYGGSNTCSSGGSGSSRKCYASGAGGGWYGGATGNHGTAGGGSGYIGNTSLYNKVMYCYNCSESSDTNTKTISTTCINDKPTSNCAKIGDGYAKITFIGSEDPNDSYDADDEI